MKKGIFLVTAFVALNILFAVNSFLDIKNADNLVRVFVKFNCSNEVFDRIKVYRIAPSDFSAELFKNHEEKIFFSSRNEYFKKLVISVPVKDLTEIKNIDITLGDIKTYSCGSENIQKEFNVKEKDGNYELTANSGVFYKKSALPKINKIINWGGDLHFVFKYFIYIAIFLFMLIFDLIIKLFAGRKYNRHVNNFNELIDLVKSDERLSKTADKLYWFVFLFIIFFAFMQRFSINLVPYNGNDTWTYIQIAINYLNGDTIANISSRGFVYSIYILPILIVFKDFNYITIIQHLLGILTGVTVFYTINLIFKKYFAESKNFYVYRIISLIVMSFYLFNPSPIVYEHSLRPEGISPFIGAAMFLLLIKLIINYKEKSFVNIVLLNVFFILNYAFYVLQPRWGFNLAFNILIYIVLAVIANYNIVKKIFFLFLLPVFISFILLYIPNNYMSAKSARGIFLAGNLLFAHAKIIDIEMQKDIDDATFKKYDKDILKKMMEYNKIEYSKKQYKHKYLGYMFNNLYYGEANRFLKSKFDIKQYKDFCYYYFFKSVTKHPDKYAKKVLLELSQFYDFYGGMYPSRQFKLDADGYWHEPFDDNSIKYMPYLIYIYNINYLETSVYDFKEIEFPEINGLYFVLSVTYLMILFIFMVLFFYSVFSFLKTRQTDGLLIFSLFILILYLYNFFISLTNAAVYCLDVARYKDDQFVFVLVSQVLAIIFIVKKILGVYDKKILK